MSYSVDTAVMRAIDKYSIEEAGIGGEVLMERAALALAGRIRADDPSCRRACVIYGRGNNGGDGLAAGRILKAWGWDVTAVPASSSVTCDTMSETERKQFRSAGFCGVVFPGYEALENELQKENCIFIDAIFGIGLNRAPEGEYADTIRRINSANVRIYSADIPSGVSADNGSVPGEAVRAYATVTFGFVKHGLLMYPGAEYAGKIYTEDAGFAVGSGELAGFAADRVPDGRIAEYYASDSEVVLPRRFPSGNKGNYGRLLVIAGNRGCTGAGYLCTHAAFMAGTGMVKVLTCRETAGLLNMKQPEAMTDILFTDEGGIDCGVLEKGLEWASMVLIGPGIGTGPDAARAVEAVLGSGKKAVFDADALNIIAGMTGSCSDRAAAIAGLFSASAVLTPHMGELARLTGVKTSELKACIFDTAIQYTYNDLLTYVCKDARTVTACGGRLHININGNSGMSTAGSGDVLAGLIAGLAAAGAEPYEAAAAGVYIHAAAGDAAAAESCEDCVTAGDISEHIAACIGRLRSAR